MRRKILDDQAEGRTTDTQFMLSPHSSDPSLLMAPLSLSLFASLPTSIKNNSRKRKRSRNDAVRSESENYNGSGSDRFQVKVTVRGKLPLSLEL